MQYEWRSPSGAIGRRDGEKRCHGAAFVVPFGADVDLPTRFRLLQALPRADVLGGCVDGRGDRHWTPTALAIRVHSESCPPGCWPGISSSGDRQLQHGGMEPPRDRAPDVRDDRDLPPDFGPAESRHGNHVSPRRPSGIAPTAHGDLRVSTLASTQVSRPATQLRFQLSCGLRFAGNPIVLQQSDLHLPGDVLDRKHVRRHVETRLGADRSLPRSHPVYGAGDLSLC